MFKILIGAFVGLAMMGVAGTNAAVIRSPTGIVGTDFGFDGSFPLTRAIDQSGLSAGYTSGVTDFDTYNATHSASFTGDAFAAAPTFPGNIDFDLGGIYTIEKFALWNDAQEQVALGRSVNTFTVFSDDNSAFSSPTDVGSFSAVGFEVGTAVKQTFDLADTVGRYVRIRILSNHGDASLQFGEMAFATSVVPLPAALPLMGTGLALLGFMGWRRKRKLKAA